MCTEYRRLGVHYICDKTGLNCAKNVEAVAALIKATAAGVVGGNICIVSPTLSGRREFFYKNSESETYLEDLVALCNIYGSYTGKQQRDHAPLAGF